MAICTNTSRNKESARQKGFTRHLHHQVRLPASGSRKPSAGGPLDLFQCRAGERRVESCSARHWILVFWVVWPVSCLVSHLPLRLFYTAGDRAGSPSENHPPFHPITPSPPLFPHPFLLTHGRRGKLNSWLARRVAMGLNGSGGSYVFFLEVSVLIRMAGSARERGRRTGLGRQGRYQRTANHSSAWTGHLALPRQTGRRRVRGERGDGGVSPLRLAGWLAG